MLHVYGWGKGIVSGRCQSYLLVSVNRGFFYGTVVDFFGIDPDTYNLSAQALKLKLEHAYRVGRMPKVVWLCTCVVSHVI